MTALDDRLIAPAATTFPPRGGRVLSAESAAAWFAIGPRHLAPRQVTVTLTDDWGNELKPFWLDEALRRVNQLVALPEAWDGYRAREVSQPAVSSAFEVLAYVMSDDRARPQIFPLVDGGLQVEWHAAGHDIEFEIEGNGSVYAIARTPQGEMTVDEELEPPTPSWSDAAQASLDAALKALSVLTQLVNDAAFA